MKIGPLTRALDYLVREKSEDRSFSQDNKESYDSEQHSKEKGPDKREASIQEIDQAIEAFQSDLNTRENGLNVSVEGNGPGLRVILKDPNGGVVRSFSGSEFVRLRQKSSKEGRLRGKLLDQKL